MVKIVQLLCPKRHALFCMAYEEGVGTFAEACEFVEQLCGAKGPYKRQCMICGSLDLHFEEAPTPYRTMKEAAPHLAKTQADNIATRLQLDAEGKTIQKLS